MSLARPFHALILFEKTIVHMDQRCKRCVETFENDLSWYAFSRHECGTTGKLLIMLYKIIRRLFSRLFDSGIHVSCSNICITIPLCQLYTQDRQTDFCKIVHFCFALGGIRHIILFCLIFINYIIMGYFL